MYPAPPVSNTFMQTSAAGLLKYIWPGGISSVALSDLGSMGIPSVVRPGANLISGWDGMEGSWAQIFTFDYAASLDAGIGLANMSRFLGFSSEPPPVPGVLRSDLAGSLSLRGKLNV